MERACLDDVLDGDDKVGVLESDRLIRRQSFEVRIGILQGKSRMNKNNKE